MKILTVILLFNLSGCYIAFTQDETLHRHFKYMTDKGIGHPPLYCGDSGCKTTDLDQTYIEVTYSFTSYHSKLKGKCTVINKVRKSDNVIVSWRYEGEKYDCLRMP